MPRVSKSWVVKITLTMVSLLVILAFAVAVLMGSAADVSEPPAPVLVVTLDSIYRMTPEAPTNLLDKNSSLTYGRGQVKAIDFNYANRSFCCIHPKILFSESEFLCTSADNFSQTWIQPNPTLFPTQSAVTAIARDWVSGVWYFADKGRRCVYMCDDRLRSCRVLRTEVDEPLGLAVDPTPGDDKQKAGFIFWSQKNLTPSRLVRSSLAGDEVSGLLPQNCSGPCTPKALTLDIVNKLVFWIEGYDVAMSSYNGGGRRLVYNIPEAYTRDIKVFSVLKSTLYMPGYRSLATVSIDLETSIPGLVNTTEKRIPVNGFTSAALVYHGSRQPQVSHPCMENKGGCEHICVTAYQGAKPVPQCLCRHGYQLDSNQHGVCTRVQQNSLMLLSRGAPPWVEVRALTTPRWAAPPAASSRPTVADVDLDTEHIYFSDTFLNRIIRQKLDGTEREEFIKDGIYECQGLAIDWMGGNLYWTDDPLGRLLVARLSDPTQRRELVKQFPYHPYSIVLDPQRGVMYWSVWARGPNPSGSIETANMDGSERRTLADDGLEWPNGLVLGMEKQVLYWCDTKLNKIESLELATNKRTTILETPQAAITDPYGLVLVDGDIMWSEQKSGLLRRLGSDGNVTIVDNLTPPLYDIRMVSKSGRSVRNAYSSDNGGCAELCLAIPGSRTCACATGRTPDPTEPSQCVEESMPMKTANSVNYTM